MATSEVSKLKPQMEEVVSFFNQEIGKLRTGRANTAIVEDIKVPYFGQNTPLKSMATINISAPDMITVQPWSPDSLNDIESTLQGAGLGFGVTNDGIMIRLTVPPMNTERREELVNLLNRTAEENKVKLRNLRREAWDSVQQKQRNSEISEDEKYSAQKELQELIQSFESQIDASTSKKEQEIRTI